ncbi:hypothetical protein [Bifidobacterium platyrrhinorum]|uniref:Terminase n=1 Tax=Bifidobacterium platyrrhinorum TaxID=2661628 RepID=A0A6L9SW85_9BIFI|nr:hypothetical protein [Bifidobacterium platyrrhinorum]NEG55461.1 hypothetical protein [Bifidobacterium platyrrhinorum]
MHDIIPRLKPDELRRSLGWIACWWIQNFCVVGSEPAYDLPYEFSPEYMEFTFYCYALDKYGRRRFNHVFLSRPKSSNKSGLAGLYSLFESLGPCRFLGWAKGGETYTFLGRTYTYRPGEPMGRPIRGPNILCLANAEEQTDNIYSVIKNNCEMGPLSALRGYGLDVGETRILLPEGGSIKPGTAGAASKDGGKQTFVPMDESHLTVLPAGKAMYHTVKRNLAKRMGDAEPWLFETTTMYRPGENSIAEETYRTAHDIQEGRLKHDQHLLFDHRYSDLPIEDIAKPDKLRKALYESYGSAAKSPDGRDYIFLPDHRMVPVDIHGRSEEGYTLMSPGVEPGPSRKGWVDVRGPIADILDPSSDVGDSVRYYLNSLTSVSDAWIAEPLIQNHLAGVNLFAGLPEGTDLDEAAVWREVISEDDAITLGFDGSLSDDATALVGCRVRDGLLFLIRLEQKPEGPEAAGWRVDVDAFDRAARSMLDDYNVVGFFADPPYWRDVIIGWERDYAHLDLVGNPMDPMMVNTNQRNQMMPAYVDVHTAFSKEWEPTSDDDEPVIGDIALLADPRFVAHWRNARRKNFRQTNPDGSPQYMVYKETKNGPLKIDACIAGVLAYMARMRYLSQRPHDMRLRTHVTRVEY